MGRTYPSLTPELVDFIAEQHLFFVASAPLAADGHVNVSPKGGDTLRVLDDRRVAYLDLTGSGVETIAHLRENGRITILFAVLDGSPNLLRLWGRGEAVLPGDVRFGDLVSLFPDLPGVRSVVVVDLERVGTSCGYGVPTYEYVGERTRLVEGLAKRGPEGVAAYQSSKNAVSLDGLPGLVAQEV